MTAALLVPLLAGSFGCKSAGEISLTRRLWEDADVQVRYVPARNPGLKLFLAPSGQEIIVLYDEFRERDDTTRRRAYLLRPNGGSSSGNSPPRFVSARAPQGLAPIPVVPYAATTPEGGSYAQLSHRPGEFSLILPGWDRGPYFLPNYEDNAFPAGKVALTPFAVVGDVVVYSVIIASIAGIFYLYARAEGSVPPPRDPTTRN